MKPHHPFHLRKKPTKVDKSAFKYSEDVLQWVWKNLAFETSRLFTTDGKSVIIFDPGKLNKLDGPDFLNAKLLIDGLIWYGSIELHLKSNGWKRHGHHLDEAYDNVILHVVVEDKPLNVFTSKGGELPTLNLLPYLPEQFSNFIAGFDEANTLPCSNNVRFISEEAFLAQIDKAHNEYLEKKGNDFLSFYNPELPQGKAWKNALILSLFDGFGISHNRESMRKIGKWFLKYADDLKYIEAENIFLLQEFNEVYSSLNWNYRSVLPANHPKKRIPQVIKLAKEIIKTPFNSLLSPDILHSWNKWIKESELLGITRLSVLYGTVYLPAIYVLGNLHSKKELSTLSAMEWNNYQVPIPKSILKSFDSLTEINKQIYSKKLGSVYQLEAYCQSLRCQECFVLKKVISS